MNDDSNNQQPTYSNGQSPVLPPVNSGAKNDREGIKSVINTVLILLLAPLLALAITAFVFQSYEVDGPSMEPTLQTKDRLIVWKLGHTWSRLTRSDYTPERGSVVVFVKRDMYDFATNKDKQLIKRVIGLPGDRVVVENGSITIFNDEYPNGFNPDDTLNLRDSLSGPTEGNTTVTVQEGEIFVVGDHRNNSMDSRVFGPIPTSDIVGTLTARILPLAEAKKF